MRKSSPGPQSRRGTGGCAVSTFGMVDRSLPWRVGGERAGSGRGNRRLIACTRARWRARLRRSRRGQRLQVRDAGLVEAARSKQSLAAQCNRIGCIAPRGSASAYVARMAGVRRRQNGQGRSGMSRLQFVAHGCNRFAQTDGVGPVAFAHGQGRQMRPGLWFAIRRHDHYRQHAVRQTTERGRQIVGARCDGDDGFRPLRHERKRCFAGQVPQPLARQPDEALLGLFVWRRWQQPLKRGSRCRAQCQFESGRTAQSHDDIARRYARSDGRKCCPHDRCRADRACRACPAHRACRPFLRSGAGAASWRTASALSRPVRRHRELVVLQWSRRASSPAGSIGWPDRAGYCGRPPRIATRSTRNFVVARGLADRQSHPNA